MRTIGKNFGHVLFFFLLQCQNCILAQPVSKAANSDLLDVLDDELSYSMRHLATEEKSKPYFLSFTITETTSVSLVGSLGALVRNDDHRERQLDVDLRVGDYTLDST